MKLVWRKGMWCCWSRTAVVVVGDRSVHEVNGLVKEDKGTGGCQGKWAAGPDKNSRVPVVG